MKMSTEWEIERESGDGLQVNQISIRNYLLRYAKRDLNENVNERQKK